MDLEPTDDILLVMAYLDGETTADEALQAESLLARDPNLKRTAEELRDQASAVASLPRLSPGADFAAEVLAALPPAETGASPGPDMRPTPRSDGHDRRQWGIARRAILAVGAVMAASIVAIALFLPGRFDQVGMAVREDVAESVASPRAIEDDKAAEEMATGEAGGEPVLAAPTDTRFEDTRDRESGDLAGGVGAAAESVPESMPLSVPAPVMALPPATARMPATSAPMAEPEGPAGASFGAAATRGMASPETTAEVVATPLPDSLPTSGSVVVCLDVAATPAADDLFNHFLLVNGVSWDFQPSEPPTVELVPGETEALAGVDLDRQITRDELNAARGVARQFDEAEESTAKAEAADASNELAQGDQPRQLVLNYADQLRSQRMQLGKGDIAEQESLADRETQARRLYVDLEKQQVARPESPVQAILVEADTDQVQRLWNDLLSRPDLFPVASVAPARYRYVAPNMRAGGMAPAEPEPANRPRPLAEESPVAGAMPATSSGGLREDPAPAGHEADPVETAPPGSVDSGGPDEEAMRRRMAMGGRAIDPGVAQVVNIDLQPPTRKLLDDVLEANTVVRALRRADVQSRANDPADPYRAVPLRQQGAADILDSALEGESSEQAKSAVRQQVDGLGIGQELGRQQGQSSGRQQVLFLIRSVPPDPEEFALPESEPAEVETAPMPTSPE